MWPALLHASNIQSDFFGKQLQIPPSGIRVVQTSTCIQSATYMVLFPKTNWGIFFHFQ